jgi:hypothetical protein
MKTFCIPVHLNFSLCYLDVQNHHLSPNGQPHPAEIGNQPDQPDNQVVAVEVCPECLLFLTYHISRPKGMNEHQP